MRTIAIGSIVVLSTATLLVAQGPQLTVDRIVSTAPSLAGTAPLSPTWSPDSRRVAFLWNDQARPNRDLWIVDATGTAPRQLTRQGAGDFVWSTDSRSLYYLDDNEIWRIDADGGQATQLAGGVSGKSDLTLSPDGTRLGFLAAGDLWLFDLATGQARQATHLAVAAKSAVGLGTYFKPDVEVGQYVWGGGMAPYAWAPDGKQIAIQVVDRREVRLVPFPYYLGDETSVSLLRRGYPGDRNESRNLSLLEVATGAIRPLNLDDPTAVQIIGFEWSPSGTLLIDRESDTAEDRWLLLVNPATREVKEVWHDHRATRIYNAVSSTWHPNGTDILFISDLDDRYRMYVLTPGTQQPRPLTGAGFDVTGDRGAFTPIGNRPTKSIVFLSTEGGPAERPVYQIGWDGGAPKRLTRRPGVYTPTLSPDGATLALLHSDDVSPPELYLMNATGGPERQVTRSPPAEYATYQWATVRYQTFEHKSEPYTLHARILEPPNLDRSKKYPVIFGPVYSNTVRNHWSGLYGLVQQLLVQRGYLVVQVDVRGSTGYGREFREKFLMDWGGGDLDDLESAVDYLKTVPYADTNRLGIWGSSYGGTLTVFMLLKKPGLFKAGVAGAPATNPHFFGSDDVAIARRPATNPEAFERGNALQYAKNLKDHLLIIHGMQDDVVPFKTSVAFADELIKLGKDFDFAFAPAATHGWTQRDYYARFLLTKLVNHFDRYLAP